MPSKDDDTNKKNISNVVNIPKKNKGNGQSFLDEFKEITSDGGKLIIP